MQFCINVDSVLSSPKRGQLSALWQAITLFFKWLIVIRELTLSVNEGECSVAISPTKNGYPVIEEKERVIKFWMTPFGCWLATSTYACFVSKRKFQEAEFRCLCRVLIWH